jgi:hypothetical protein
MVILVVGGVGGSWFAVVFAVDGGIDDGVRGWWLMVGGWLAVVLIRAYSSDKIRTSEF